MSDRLERYVHATFRDYYTFLPGNCTNFTSFKYLLKHTNTNSTMIVSGKELMKDIGGGFPPMMLLKCSDVQRAPNIPSGYSFQLPNIFAPGGPWKERSPCNLIGKTTTAGWPGGLPGDSHGHCQNYFEYILDKGLNPTTTSRQCISLPEGVGVDDQCTTAANGPTVMDGSMCNNSGIPVVTIPTPAPPTPPSPQPTPPAPHGFIVVGQIDDRTEHCEEIVERLHTEGAGHGKCAYNYIPSDRPPGSEPVELCNQKPAPGDPAHGPYTGDYLCPWICNAASKNDQGVQFCNNLNVGDRIHYDCGATEKTPGPHCPKPEISIAATCIAEDIECYLDAHGKPDGKPCCPGLECTGNQFAKFCFPKS